MKKLLILALILISSSKIVAQKILKEDFANTEWFINSTEDFHKSDTISLIKMENYKTDYKTLSKAHIISYYNNGNDVDLLSLERKDKAYFWNITSNVMCGKLGSLENWKWKFDNETQVLNLYSDNNLSLAFKVIGKEIEEAKWQYEVENGKMTNFEAKYLKFKLCRIK